MLYKLLLNNYLTLFVNNLLADVRYYKDYYNSLIKRRVKSSTWLVFCILIILCFITRF